MPSPPIPEVPKDSPSGIYKLFSAIKEALEIGLGRRGNISEKFVTRGELADIGVIESATSTSISGLGNAAFKNVGTGAGTVAAGDHLHTGVYDPAGTASSLVAAHEGSASPVHTLDQISAEYDSSSDFSTLKDIVDTQFSTGIVGTSGLITDEGLGSVRVAAANILIRSTNSDSDELKFFKVPVKSLAPTDLSHNYIYAEYNAGTPQYIVTVTKRTDTNTNVLIGTVYRDGTAVHINNNFAVRANDNLRRVALRLVDTLPFQRVSGGIATETGTRNIAITAGEWWECTNPFTTSAIDTSATSTFIAAYRDGLGGWTEQAAQTQIDNTYYDDGTGVLAALTASHYATRWVYIETDSDVVVVYGRADHVLEADAEDEAEPDRPPRITATGRLIAKIIIRKSDASFTSIQNAFDSDFEFSTPTIHNALGGLQGGTAGEFYHFTSTQHTDLTDGGQSTLHGHPSSLINIPVIGSPTNITNLEDATNYLWSAGVVSGCGITDNLDGTVAVAAGEALLRESAGTTSMLRSLLIPATAVVSLTDQDTTYIYADYNAGSPSVGTTLDISGFNCLDKCLIGAVSREGTHLHIISASEQNVDANRKFRRRSIETSPFLWVPGGSILGTSGLYVTLTAGAFWYTLDKITHGAIDTSQVGAGDDRDFSTYYRNGVGGWTKTTGVKTLNNTQYDDSSGVLATLNNNKFGVHWLFMALGDNPHMAVVYGQAEYANVAEAQASFVPSTLPPVFEGTTVLVGRVIFEKSAASMTSTETAFSTSFSTSTPSAHNNLSMIQGGTSNEYFHFTATQHTDLTDAGDSTLHYHATDRDLANATGTLGGAVALTLPSTIEVNSASDAIRITQTGTGNAIVVEDSANPDATPFVVNGAGVVINGHTSALALGGSGGTPAFQEHTTSTLFAGGAVAAVSWATGGAPAGYKTGFYMARSNSGAIGTYSIVSSGYNLGEIRWTGDDGTQFVQAATIAAFCDGTPGVNDMPGRLSFYTTPDGSSTPSEAARIDSSQITTHSAKFGYGLSGSGGTITQITSKSTGVTLNTPSGQITMHNAALAASTTVSFTLTNSSIEANDTVLVHRKSAGTAASYVVGCDSVAAGSCVIYVRNTSAGSLSEAVVLQFSVIKSAIA